MSTGNPPPRPWQSTRYSYDTATGALVAHVILPDGTEHSALVWQSAYVGEQPPAHLMDATGLSNSEPHRLAGMDELRMSMERQRGAHALTLLQDLTLWNGIYGAACMAIVLLVMLGASALITRIAFVLWVPVMLKWALTYYRWRSQ